MPWKMDLPGSPVLMCHQLTVTGAGVPVGPAVVFGAVVALGVASAVEQAPAINATAANPVRNLLEINFTFLPPWAHRR
jgi:hypothetical protein